MPAFCLVFADLLEALTDPNPLEAGRKTNSAEGEHFDRYYEYFARGLNAAYPRVNASVSAHAHGGATAWSFATRLSAFTKSIPTRYSHCSTEMCYYHSFI